MIKYSSISKDGGRSVNEDSLGNWKKGEKYFFCLADGLGGHGGGDIASQTAVSAAIDFFNASDDPNSENVLRQCFTSAQELVLNKQLQLNKTDEMKTTLVLLCLSESVAQWGHIGDSRLYLFRKGKYFQRTLDHSVPQMLVATGEIKEEQIRDHEDRNRLIRVIGTEWASPRYDIAMPCTIKKEDSFLLCSDGFWELIDEKNMMKCLKTSKTPEQWLDAMEKEVIKNGTGKNMDNYSAIAIFIR